MYTLCPYTTLFRSFVNAVGASVDVTVQKDATLALSAAEGHYRRLVETSPYGIFAIDSIGRFTEINPAAAAIVGVPARDRKSTRLDSSHSCASRMPSSA